jgi:hypothetical protein
MTLMDRTKISVRNLPTAGLRYRRPERSGNASRPRQYSYYLVVDAVVNISRSPLITDFGASNGLRQTLKGTENLAGTERVCAIALQVAITYVRFTAYGSP